MEISISWNTQQTTEKVVKDVASDESSYWEAVGKQLLEIPIPTTVDIESSVGNVRLKVRQRGTYTKNGIKKPSMFVTEESNTVHGLAPSTYPETYLTCVNPESNNYKFYKMIPKSDGIHVTYGRIGAEKGEMYGARTIDTPYPLYLFWIRYYEKLSKGYMDSSKIYLAEEKPKKTKKVVQTLENNTQETTDSLHLYRILKRCARQVVEENLQNTHVTRKQVETGRRFLKTMGERKTVKGFNRQLLNLLSVSPRRTLSVNSLLAVTKDDFSRIIQREENLLTAMEALVHEPTQMVSNVHEGFSKYGIEVYLATKSQKNEVLARLSDTLKPHVKNVYRVINSEHKKRFDAYVKQNSIQTVKRFWHGSRNENWLSIAVNGLKLNPNAVITGKMFGQGIYFAPSSMKSWNYTSFRGTSWAHGRSDTGFMGLYVTAYGNPNNVYDAHSFTQKSLVQNGYNCVHAHAGSSLRNDEIVFYSEDAMLLQYIVEFSE